MRRRAGGVILAAVAVVASSCTGAGPQARTVLVDFSHDEFSSFMIGNFPKEVAVAPGDTVTFKQTWTGEPHTVTGGTLVDDMMAKAKNLLGFFTAYDTLAGTLDLPDPEGETPPKGNWADVLRKVERSKEEPTRTEFLESYDGLIEDGAKLPPRDDPGDATFEDIDKIVTPLEEEVFPEDSPLPWALDEGDKGVFVTQNAGQRCFLTSGAPPKDADKACSDSQQRQPEFDGKAAYYNSGIIPYEGPQGNTFQVRLASDVDPGSYFFYCAVHGPSQYTELQVRPEGTDVPSQEDVSRQARREIQTFTDPMKESYDDAADGSVEVFGQEVRAPFGGVPTDAQGSINEFLPKTIRTRVGRPVTWKLIGANHTITFDVPRYFPIIRFARNGKVSLNPRLSPPAGGSPKIPEQEGRGVVKVDGGSYDGSGFFSSGLYGAEPYATYTLRFSEPGRYQYACLIHPPMVGTVVVT
jgi:plastocyanin